MPPEDKTATGELTGAKAHEQTSTDPIEVRMPSEAFKKRLDETRDGSRRELLKKYGFESEAALERRLKALKDVEDAQLSEHEKLKKRLEELEPRDKRAAELEERYAKQLNKQVAALPEHLQKIVAERAKTPEQIEEYLDVFAEAGLLKGDAKADAAAALKGASTAPSAKQPKQDAAPTKFEEWQRLDSKPETRVQAGVFYQMNRDAIERDRPAPTG